MKNKDGKIVFFYAEKVIESSLHKQSNFDYQKTS